MQTDKLIMKFDLQTIEHLGIQMYYTLPPVIAELVSNSYDADAKNVTIKFLMLLYLFSNKVEVPSKIPPQKKSPKKFAQLKICSTFGLLKIMKTMLAQHGYFNFPNIRCFLRLHANRYEPP